MIRIIRSDWTFCCSPSMKRKNESVLDFTWSGMISNACLRREGWLKSKGQIVWQIWWNIWPERVVCTCDGYPKCDDWWDNWQNVYVYLFWRAQYNALMIGEFHLTYFRWCLSSWVVNSFVYLNSDPNKSCAACVSVDCHTAHTYLLFTRMPPFRVDWIWHRQWPRMSEFIYTMTLTE